MSERRQRDLVIDPTAATRRGDSPVTRRCLWAGLALALAILAVYQPTWDARFIWDDDAHLTAHPSIVGPLGLKEVWTTSAANYFPLVLTTFWALHKVFGLDPLVFHLVGIVLHVACTLLLWAVLRRLRVPGAWVGAALWGLHPVQVESVAWVSEIINTQSGVFFLGSIWFATRWLDPEEPAQRSGGDYAAALVCALAAMLSKPSTVMLPVALGLVCWWRRGRVQWRDARWLAPFFVLAVATSGWAIWEQRVHHHAVGGEWDQSPAERIIIAGRAVWFYAGKLLWPYPLSFIYPRWTIESGRLVSWLPAGAAVGGIAGLAYLAFKHSPVWRGVFFAVAYHVALLFPVLGFFNVYFFRYSFVADHFQYLASMGLLTLAGAAIATAANRLESTALLWRMATTATAAILVSFSILGWRHARIFADDETLWRATLKTNPKSVLAHNNLGVLLVDAGRPADAIEHYERALETNPGLVDTRYNLGKALARVPERMPEAIRQFEAVLQARPNFEEARHNLAIALAAMPARRADAIVQYEAVVRLNPQNARAHSDLGVVLGGIPDRLQEAIRHGEIAVQLKSDLPEAHFNLANNLSRIPERKTEAVRHYEAALKLKPDYVKAHINLGLLYARSAEQLPAAIRHYEAALALEPRSAIAHNNLAIALAQGGRREEAQRHFERAIELDPGYSDARNNLSRLTGRAMPPAP
ncbi:MAG: tetratricopeptide repeat protein [Opitutaceae bacterium]|nr:tetratricopeptide repeat protein [Opitutaceae bacterium]